MLLVNLIQEDFTNYKKPAMFLGFPYCTGKCNIANKKVVCQNEQLHNADKIEISIQEIIDLYNKNNLVHAIVCGGLEPLDSSIDLLHLIEEFRKNSQDDFVIYTGYNKEEPQAAIFIQNLKNRKIKNIIMKFGRYFEGDEPHYDEVLGVNLISNNQYAEIVV
jgi:uncharacterized protein